MNVILKHTLNSAKQNKIQVAMIIITIIIVAIAVFVSFSMSDIFYNIQSIEYDRLQQDGNILMYSDPSSGAFFSGAKFKKEFVDPFPDEVESYELMLRLQGIMITDTDSQIITIEATDINSYLQRHPLFAIDNSQIPLDYERAIISERFATAKNVKVGDNIKVYISLSDTFQTYSVYTIAENDGIFSSPNGLNILVERSSVQFNNTYNCAVLKLKDPKATTSLFIENLNANYSGYSIQDFSNYNYINDIVTNNTLLFSIGILFVMIMMALILFSSYLIIAKQRVNEMVIFKSAGATPTQTFKILMGEVLFYGVIGSVIGVLIGRLIMYLMVTSVLPSATKIITFEWHKYLFTIVATLATVALSTLSPILKTSKKTIRELLANITKEVKYKKPIFIVVLITAITGILIAFSMVRSTYIIALLLILLPLIALLVHYSTPYLILFFSKIASTFNTYSIQLSSQTIKRNSSTQLVTVLLAIVISFSFMITQVVNLVTVAITPYNTRYTADYVLISGSSGREQALYLHDKYISTEGVSDIIVYNNYDTTIVFGDKTFSNGSVFALTDCSTINNFTAIDIDVATLKRFNDAEPTAIINIDLANQLNIKIGDKISTKMSESVPYSDVPLIYFSDYEYTVVGFDYTVTEYDKLFFINEKFDTYHTKDDTETVGKRWHGYQIFIVASTPSDQLFTTLRQELSEDTVKGTVLKFDEWAFVATKGLEGVVSLLTMVQVLIGIITFLGIINIIVVTFFDRKSEFKIFKNSGLTDKNFNRLAICESVILALAGMVLSIILSFAINTIFPAFTAIIQKFILFDFFPISIVILSIVCCGLFLVFWNLIAGGVKKKILTLGSYNERSN